MSLSIGPARQLAVAVVGVVRRITQHVDYLGEIRAGINVANVPASPIGDAGQLTARVLETHDRTAEMIKHLCVIAVAVELKAYLHVVAFAVARQAPIWIISDPVSTLVVPAPAGRG